MNILLAHPELSDNGIFTASNYNPDFPVENLQRIQPSEKWVTNDLNDVYVIVDLKVQNYFNFIALLHNNSSSSAIWRIRTSNTQAGLIDSPNYDSGNINLWPTNDLNNLDFINSFHYTQQLLLFNRFVRIDIIDANNSANYFSVGRLYISKVWIPENNISYGWSIGYVDRSLLDETDGGNLFPTKKGKFRQLLFTIEFENEDSMMNGAYEIDRLRGSSKDIIVIRDIESLYVHKQFIYGLSLELDQIVNHNYGIYQKRYKVWELI